MRILMIGDIVGRPGRDFLREILPDVIKKENVHFVIANGENAARGLGITEKVAREIFELGVNVITGGNHIWDKKDILEYINRERNIIRPANYPADAPGKGSVICVANGYNIAVLNLLGRVYLPPIDCPFKRAREELNKLKSITPNIIVDFHAEATSEKMAMGWYLDGKVSAVIGTHTHVQTADERILPQNTAYISDVGMTGAYNSVLGVETGPVIKKFTTGLPVKLPVSYSPGTQLNAFLIEINPNNGHSILVKRIFELNIYN